MIRKIRRRGPGAKQNVDRLPIPTEEQEQAVVVSWLRYNRILFTHPANEGMHKVQYRVKQARLGMSPGVPDLLIFDPPPDMSGCGCAIEMKRSKGGVVSEAQQNWLLKLEERGWLTIIAKGADEAIKALQAAGYGQ